MYIKEGNNNYNSISVEIKCKHEGYKHWTFIILLLLAGYPLRGNHQHVWFVWNIEYFKLLSLSAWVKYYYRISPLQTHHARVHKRTHMRVHAPARTRAHTPPHTPLSPYRYSMGLCQPTVTARSAGDNSWSLAIEINTGTDGPVSPRFWAFFRIYKKMLGRTDTRTHERMYCQTIRTVRDISRDDRARIATCSLRTPTDRRIIV